MESFVAALHEAFGGNPLEIVAAVLAITYLVLAMRRNIWCWVCGLISSVIYFVVMARSGLVMDALLQIYYVIMSVYGYLEWRRGEDQNGELNVVTWRLSQHVAAVAAVVLLTSINAYALQWMAPAVETLSRKLGFGYVQVVRSPWLDSFVTWGSVLTTWLVARRVLENWLYWIAVDGIAAGLYYSRGLKVTAMLFVIYVVMVVYGYYQWRNKLMLQAATA